MERKISALFMGTLCYGFQANYTIPFIVDVISRCYVNRHKVALSNIPDRQTPQP